MKDFDELLEEAAEIIDELIDRARFSKKEKVQFGKTLRILNEWRMV